MSKKDNFSSLPDSGFVRVWIITGDKKRNIPPLIPISRSAFLKSVKDKKWPFLKPVKLSERTTAYPVEQVRQLIAALGGKAA